ncbi:MAG: extracellular solute-binding protein [Ruminococcus sp.]|nr:extracellular solute-binding protein [Ruminococcus sp.]
MKKIKAFLSAMLMVSAMFAVTGCGGSDSSYDNPMDEDKKNSLTKTAEASGLLGGELENKNIKWLSNWDINPDATGKKTPADLVLFQEIYGGNIEYYSCDDNNRYSKLAEYVSSGKGIDFFYAGDFDVFPKFTLKGSDYFAPIDDYIDFDSELWKDAAPANDQLVWGGKHYLAVIQATGDNVACIYNRKTVQEAGLSDPADLYANGEWTWDAFEEMLEKFVDTGNDRYGIDSWFFEFGLMNTIGVPPVGIEDGKLRSYIDTPQMERVQNWIYDLYQKGYIAIGVGDYGWESRPQYIGEGKLLFYPAGLYELYMTRDKWTQKFGEDAAFVPMPKDPKADAHYIPVGMEAYAFVKGGQNPEGVAKYLDCKRFCMINSEAKSIADSIFVDDYGWSQEMVDMREEMNRLGNEHPTFDLSKGVSADCGELLNNALRNTARGKPWNETFAEIEGPVKNYIDEVNDSVS